MDKQQYYPQAPPPYGMNPSQPPAPTTVIVQATVLGGGPCSMQCPSCHAQIQTRVEHESTTKTHLFALLLCLICCPCVFIPYCTDSCKSAHHYCPSCGTFLGAYNE